MRSRTEVKSKVVSLEEIAKQGEKLRAAGRRIVATNGCFDILHVGHVRYLASARKLGDILVVGVNGDASVRKLKGDGRPVNREKDRAEILAALRSVDYVVIFPQTRATVFLEAVKPDVYVKGGDYKSETLDSDERNALESLRSTIRIIPFEAGYSTSAIIDKLCPKHPA